MDKYLTSHGYKLYCGSTKLGKLYHDDTVHTIKGVEHLYKVVVDRYKLEKENSNLRQESCTTNHFKTLLKDQCKKFPTALTFDYLELINDGVLSEDKLDSFFHPELVQLIDSMTTSKKSETTSSSQLYSNMKNYEFT